MVEYQVLRFTLWDGRNGIVSQESRDEEIEIIKMEGWSYLLVYGVVVSGWLGIYGSGAPIAPSVYDRKIDSPNWATIHL